MVAARLSGCPFTVAWRVSNGKLMLPHGRKNAVNTNPHAVRIPTGSPFRMAHLRYEPQPQSRSLCPDGL